MKHKLTQSLSATGAIKRNGAAGIFCPDEGVENTDGVALLGIRIKKSTLERIDGERVTIVIYPATKQKVAQPKNKCGVCGGQIPKGATSCHLCGANDEDE